MSLPIAHKPVVFIFSILCIYTVYKNFTVTSVTCTALCDVFRKRRTRKRSYATGRRTRNANVRSQTRIENIGTGLGQDGRDQDRGQENVPTTGPAETRRGTESREAEIENPEAGIGNQGVEIANLGAEIGSREAVTVAGTELNQRQRVGTRNLEAGM